MAKFESEGYCPCQWVDLSSDNRLVGLWSLIGSSVVYEKEDEVKCSPDTQTCDKAFSTDPIAYDVLSAIVKKNVHADKILVHQPHAGSNFIVVISDASYGLDVWIWNLASCW